MSVAVASVIREISVSAAYHCRVANMAIAIDRSNAFASPAGMVSFVPNVSKGQHKRHHKSGFMPQIFHIKAKIGRPPSLSLSLFLSLVQQQINIGYLLVEVAHNKVIVLFCFVFNSLLPFGLSQHTWLLWGARWVSLSPGMGGSQLQWLCRVARLPAWHMSKATRMQLPAGLHRTAMPNRWVQVECASRK